MPSVAAPRPPESIAALGDVMQLCFINRDFEGTLKFGREVMGAGPFFLNEKVILEELLYMGRPSDVDFRVAIGYWGDLQIEIIEQRNDAPSIYRDWLDGGHEGLQHVCLMVDDLAKARAVCEAAGAVIAQEGRLPGGRCNFLYADTGGGPGTMVEIVQPGPGMVEGFAAMREAARNWDGTDPVRPRGAATIPV